MVEGEKASESVLTGRSVLAIFLGFFAVVFAVNGVFLYQALSTRTGIVANEPYRKGLKYNERIAADERQGALGWKSEIALSADAKSLTVALTTEKGEPVVGLSVVGRIGRPATDKEDHALTLVEEKPGAYAAAFPVTEPGAYIADIEISDFVGPEGTVLFRARRRLWIQQ